MAEIKFLVRVPMDCWRQWVRHRTANINEYSTRYSLAIEAAQGTPEDQWRTQAESNRQGSGDALPVDLGAKLTIEEQELQQKIRSVYQSRIETGVAREQARKDLPLSTYTEAYWKIDLHNLLHFLALRMDSHAQLEIRNYATAIGEKIVAPLFPMVWEAFLDYRMQSMFLTRLDREVIQRLTANAAAAKSAPPYSNEEFLAAQDPSWVSLNRSRERDECRSKLELLGLLAKF
jgi:thymidylate synthase (FAD)